MAYLIYFFNSSVTLKDDIVIPQNRDSAKYFFLIQNSNYFITAGNNCKDMFTLCFQDNLAPILTVMVIKLG